MSDCVNILFTVNEYDRDGDVTKEGIFLHFGETRVYVCSDIETFDVIVENMAMIRDKLKENYR